MRFKLFDRSSRVLLAFAAASAVGACKKEVQFTRIPVAGVLEAEAKPTETRIFLSIPANLASALDAIEAAVPAEVAKSKDLIDDIACDRRKGPWLECMTGNVTTVVTRAGPAEATIEGTRLLVTLPLKYEINAKGLGWAAYLTDRKTGNVTVGVPFDVALGAGYKLDVKMGSELIWSEKTSPILKGKMGFARIADPKIKGQLKAAGEPLRQAIAAQPIRDMTDKAWKALHSPVELTRNPSLWLRGLPERVVGAGFAFEDGQFIYRIGLDTKVGIHRGERPAPLFVNPLPEPARIAANAAQTANKSVLRLPFDVSAPGLEAAVAAAFPKTDILETRADAKSASIKVKTTGVQVYPARDRVALELQLDVVEPQRLLGMTGKAYLIGKPVLDRQTGILDLRDIGFPAAPPKESKTPPGLIRIGEEPFAGRFAAAARLNVAGPLDSLLPRLNTQIKQPLSDAMEISGQFDAVVIKSVEPLKGGFRFNLELDGVLALKSTLAQRAPGSLQQTGGGVASPPTPTPPRAP